MLIIAILAAVAIPAYVSSIRAAREAVLKEDLHVLRDSIDSYTNDKNKAPQSLDDLVSAGYLKSIPVDPMTHSPDLGNRDGRHDSEPGPDRSRANRRAQRLGSGRWRWAALLQLVDHFCYTVAGAVAAFP